MAEKPSKPKMGRPPLPPGKRRGASMGFRPTPEIRKMLEESAKQNGRSMSQEVEAHLERSLLMGGLLTFMSGDPRTADFVRELLEAKSLIEGHQGKTIWDDFESHEAMKTALKELLDERAPKPARKFEKQMADYEQYVEAELKPWWERGGGGLLGNPDAGPRPTLEPSPLENARLVGRAVASVVRRDRLKALAEALMKGEAKED
jgi:hypothetical protein